MQHFLNYLKYLEERKFAEPVLDPPSASIHQIQISMRQKTKRILNNFLIGFIVAILVVSALGKIFHAEAVTESLKKVGVGKFMTILGFIELGLALLFISSRTMKTSFVLLSCYFSGAIATEVTHDGNFIIPLCFLLLIWIASFVRAPYLLKLAGDIKSRHNYHPWNLKWTTIE